jgi:hypothetical protein
MNIFLTENRAFALIFLTLYRVNALTIVIKNEELKIKN